MSDPSVPLAERAHVLYRMFDSTGRLLYVGITAHVETRLSQHKAGKDWWPDVATVRLEHFASRADVEEAEREAIRTEGPAFNVAHTLRPTPPPRTGSRRKTPLRTTQIEDDLWSSARACADVCGDTLSAVMRDGVREYVEQYGHLLADA